MEEKNKGIFLNYKRIIWKPETSITETLEMDFSEGYEPNEACLLIHSSWMVNRCWNQPAVVHVKAQTVEEVKR